MADTPPISTEVPETVTVDTGADPASVQGLNNAFEDFWKEQDSETPPAPEPPSAPSAPGEAKAAPEPEPKPAESRPVETIPPAKDYSDDEINRMELPPNARPELQEQFKQVKAVWMSDRAKLRAEAEKAKALENQLNEAKQNSWTPEAKADYEHAASIRRKYDFVSDPEFIQKYQAPIRTQFETILDDVAKVLPNRQAGEAWAQHVKENYKPDGLTREWWLRSVLDQIPDELDRSTAKDEVTKLLNLQRERDTEVKNRTSDKSSFDQWIAEKTETTAKRVQEEIMGEIGIQEKQIQEILPRDVAQAKTSEERVAIEKHNERFNRLNTVFQDTVKDISANGPRAWVRASVQAARAALLFENNGNLMKELEAVKTERDQLRKELDKITGARRRMTHTTGTPPAPTGEKKNGTGLSLKDLDVRKSFDSYDWGEGT